MNETTLRTSNGATIDAFSVSGTVMSAETRTEFSTVRDRDTHIGNGKMLPGQVYNEASTVQDVWIRTEDGKEMKLAFQPLGLAMRAGHAVVFMCGKDDKGQTWCLGARNLATGEIKTSTSFAKKMAGDSGAKGAPKLPFSAWWIQLPALLFAAVVFSNMEGGRYWMTYFLSTVFWGGIGLLAIHIWRLSKRADTVGKEVINLVRERLEALPAR